MAGSGGHNRDSILGLVQQGRHQNPLQGQGERGGREEGPKEEGPKEEGPQEEGPMGFRDSPAVLLVSLNSLDCVCFCKTAFSQLIHLASSQKETQIKN